MQGIIIINKPKGFTSQDVVSKIKKILNVKKAGHTGTLDPMATGVLPILLGNYTKLSKYLIEHDKTYIAKIKLGKKTDTGDSEGNIIGEKEVILENLSEIKIQNILDTFIGIQNQIPPMYSAIKVNGKKLYEYARIGKTLEVNPRKIEIYSIKLLNIDKVNFELEFEVSCSKGTYIRVLCEDISKKLNTVGFMSELKRTSVDKFNIESSVDLYTLEKNIDNTNFIKSKIISMEQVFDNLDKIKLFEKQIKPFLNGVMLTFKKEDGIYNIYNQANNYLGTGIIKNNLLKRDVIIF